MHWKKISLAAFALAVGLLTGSCGAMKHTPTNTSTEVHVKDSTIFHIKDSIRVIERSRYKDYAGLLDTLRVDGRRSHSKSWIDTTFNIINTELIEDPQEEKTRIVYKDRLVYKDSLVYVEKPVPVEIVKEKKVYPRFLITMSILGIVFCLLFLFLLYEKLKKKLPLG